MPKTINTYSNTATAATCHLKVAEGASWLAFYRHTSMEHVDQLYIRSVVEMTLGINLYKPEAIFCLCWQHIE